MKLEQMNLHHLRCYFDACANEWHRISIKKKIEDLSRVIYEGARLEEDILSVYRERYKNEDKQYVLDCLKRTLEILVSALNNDLMSTDFTIETYLELKDKDEKEIIKLLEKKLKKYYKEKHLPWIE